MSSKPSRETEKILGRKKVRPKTRALLERSIEVAQLPVVVPRGVGADFVPCSVRTLARAEQRGELTAIRRGQSIGYERTQFFAVGGNCRVKAFVQLPAAKPARRPRAAA